MIRGHRVDFGERGVPFLAGGAVLLLFAIAIAVALAAGDMVRVLLLLGLAASPVLLYWAVREPYVFPYCLYVVLIPFDGLLQTGSGTITKFLGIIATAFILIAMARRRQVMKLTLPAYLALAFLVCEAVSLMWSPDVPLGLVDVESIGSYVLMYVFLSMAPISGRELRAVCVAIVAGGVLASLYGLYLLHGAVTTQNDALLGDAGRLMIEVGGRRIDPNQFADALLGPLAIALVALAKAGGPVRLFGMLLVVATLLAGIVVSISLEALVASLAIVVTVILLSRRRVLGLALLAAVGAFVVAFVPAISQRIAASSLTGGAGRSGVWHVDLVAWTVHPFFGWGAAGATYAYDAFLLRVAPHYFNGWGRPPHNTLLVALVDLGVVGALIVAGTYLSSFGLLRIVRRGSALYSTRVALTAALVGLGVGSLFIDMSNYKYLWVIVIAVAQLHTVAALEPKAAAP